MTDQPSFIEVQFPVSKVSKESYKERKANLGQTLTGLGKWWGRKPLILVRSTILGLLMPSSDDPIKDREIFLKILTMDADGFWLRKSKPMKDITVIENLTFKELKEYFEVPVDLFMGNNVDQNQLIKKAVKSNISKLKWKINISKVNKEKATRIAFDRLSYDERLNYVLRPEEVHLSDNNQWKEINDHLNTNATSLRELIRELGFRKFGRNAIVGDSFCGGGSIPFEAARIGCDAFGSELNPIAGLLTWASLNIAGASDEKIAEIRGFQQKVYDVIDKQIIEWDIETNEKGHKANSYLYCNETTCPECGYLLPLSPTWVIGKGTMTVAVLKDNGKDGFDTEIKSGVSAQEMKETEELVTVKSGNIYCPHCKQTMPIPALRKDRRGDNGETTYGLRLWEKDEFIPKESDTFRERLFCIRYEYENAYYDKKGKLKTKKIRYYRSPTKNDLSREQKVINLLKERFGEWSSKSYIPTSKIEPGDKTDEPIRTRGWQYWHQLFNPRQLLVHGLFIENIVKLAKTKCEVVIGLLGVNRLSNFDSKISRWNSGAGVEKVVDVFSNQALNTLYNYGTRAMSDVFNAWYFNINNAEIKGKVDFQLRDARTIINQCDLWITDPPYADAINYHELSEFFLAWNKGLLKKVFPEWYTDSKRILAVNGTGESFIQSMIEIYRNLSNHMSDNGMQVVMFTHQSPAVWADLTLILKLNPRLCRGEWQKLCLSIYTNNLLLYIALLECLKICNIAEGGRDEKKFITYSMGLQVSYCLGPQEATQDSVW